MTYPFDDEFDPITGERKKKPAPIKRDKFFDWAFAKELAVLDPFKTSEGLYDIAKARRGGVPEATIRTLFGDIPQPFEYEPSALEIAEARRQKFEPIDRSLRNLYPQMFTEIDMPSEQIAALGQELADLKFGRTTLRGDEITARIAEIQNQLGGLSSFGFKPEEKPQMLLESIIGGLQTEEGIASFVEDIRAKGRNEDTETLLRTLGVSNEDIDKIFVGQENLTPEPQAQMNQAEPIVMPVDNVRTIVFRAPDSSVFDKQGNWIGYYNWEDGSLFNPYKPKGFLGKLAYNFIAGIGDMMNTGGGTARWLGFEDVGTKLSTMATELQNYGTPYTSAEFQVSDLLNPDYYATKVTRAIPFSLTLMPLGIGGFYGGAALAAKVGLGKIWSMIVGGLVGGALSRTAESAMEAGSQYDDAIARGKTEAEADKEAREVFTNNMKLAGMDAFQIAIALAPTPKWVPASLVRSGLVRTARIGGKMVIVGLTEGGEEVYQDMIQRHARGEEWKLDPVSKEVFAIGAIMGLGMGLGGDVIQSIVNRADSQMPPNLKSQYNEAIQDIQGQGFSGIQAKLRALDVIAQTPEGDVFLADIIRGISGVTPKTAEIIGGVRAELPTEGIPEKPVTPEVTKETLLNMGRTQGNRLILEEAGILTPDTSQLTISEIVIKLDEIQAKLDKIPISRLGKPQFRKLDNARITLLKLAEQESGLSETGLRNVAEGLPPPRVVLVIPKAEAGMPEAGLQPSMLPEEVAAKEVRPPGKGRVVQISMEDQLKLEQARQEAAEKRVEEVKQEEAPAEQVEAYEAQAEAEGLKAWRQSEPASRLVNLIKKTGWYKGEVKDLTLKQYRDITGKTTILPNILTKDGKHVRWEYALDDIATEMGYESSDALKAAIEQSGEALSRIKELETKVKQLETRPLETLPEPTLEQAKENQAVTGKADLTPAQIAKTLELFGNYVDSPTAVDAWELTRELRRETRVGRFENLKARAQELIVSKGLSAEESLNQSIKETLSGELPVISTDYMIDLTQKMRDVLFAKVHEVMKDYPSEMASTYTALVNALDGKAIPRERGIGSILFPKGGSAWDRLNYVFGEQPKVIKALDRIATEKKPLKDVVEGIYHEIGREPIPLDPEMVDYLRSIPEKPIGQARLGEELFIPKGMSEVKTAEQIAQETLLLKLELAPSPIPVTKFEAPIEDAIKQMPLLPRPAMESVVRVLKELGMLPVDIGNFLRANKASFDFSFWRQQAPLIVSHPISFVRANIEAWKALWSQKSAEASWVRITRDPLYEIYAEAERNGGDFLRPLTLKKGTAQYKGTEEYGYSKGVERVLPKLTAKIPWVKLSARAFETGTNAHNWLIFKSYYNAMLRYSEQIASGQKKLKTGEMFDMMKEMVDFSKSLANFTARGSLGKFAATAPELSGLFFAPRAAIGRILSVKDLINANPRVRLEAWKNAASFVGTFGGIVLLGAAMGWWEVERDPRNAEYMSIRIGNTRIDPWGGFRQFLVFFARAITKTGVSSVTGAEYEVDPINLIQTFIRGKASPLASTILDFWRGKNFIGEEVDVANKAQWAERVAPFALWDIYEAYKDDPVHALQAGIPAILGAGVQTYTGDWRENFTKMGLPKYSDNLAYGITEPKYDTQDFWADTAGQFKDVDPATLTKEKGFPDYIRAIVETRVINERLDTMPNQTLTSLNADTSKGITYSQYYQMWRDREAIVASGDKEKLAEFDKDERTRNAHLGNFSQRQFALLNEYWSITDKKKKAEFLEQHKAEIGINPRFEYIKSHPKENAQLAVWGQAKILSLEAYNQFLGLVKTLDIPDSALPEMTMPPKESVKNYFDYQDMENKNSWEAQLLLKKDDKLREWLKREPIDTPLASLELKIKDRKLFDILDSYSDKESPDYIADDKARAKAIKDFKAKNPEFVDDMRQIEAIEKGTDEKPIDDKLVKSHVDYGKLIDQEGIGSSSAEVMLYRVDNPDYDTWRQDADIWGDKVLEPVDQTKIPIWRIDVKYRKEDAWYNEGIKEKHAKITYANQTLRDKAIRDERAAYMVANEAYRKDDRKRQAYGLTNSKTGFKFPTTEVENYVNYNEIPIKGKRRDRFLVENPSFANALYAVGQIADIPKPEDVPAVQYDDIYDQFPDQFDEIEGNGKPESEWFEPDPIKRAARDKELRFDYAGKYTKFGLAELQRNAYGALLPELYTNRRAITNPIDDYVGYYTILGEGKPKDYPEDVPYWEDDWWMIEHPEFYKEVYLNPKYWDKPHERKDYRLVPTREVGAKYLVYVGLKTREEKDIYRLDNRDLDEWGSQKKPDGSVFIWKETMSGRRRRLGITAGERFKERLTESRSELDKWLAGIK